VFKFFKNVLEDVHLKFKGAQVEQLGVWKSSIVPQKWN
jgi:hypothetical protein